MTTTQTVDDGGPAFPITSDCTTHPSYPGMTLRDYFAAKAMQGFVIDSELVADEDPAVLSQVATDSYALADAMLVARNLSPSVETLSHSLATIHAGEETQGVRHG